MPRDSRLANILLAAYAVFSLLALSLPAGPWVLAGKRLLAYAVLPSAARGAAAVDALSAVPSNWGALVRADLENRDLREKLAKAQLDETEANAVLAENASLRAVLGVRPRVPWRFVTARVIERDPATWFSSVVVDQGEAAGVRPGAAVFALAGDRLAAAGRVVETTTDTARVLLLSDELSAAAAAIEPAGWEGLVEGEGGSELRMSYIPFDALPRVGDEVATSATSVTFPPGVLIGTVSRVLEVDPHLPYRSVEVRPAVHPAQVSWVMIREAKP